MEWIRERLAMERGVDNLRLFTLAQVQMTASKDGRKVILSADQKTGRWICISLLSPPSPTGRNRMDIPEDKGRRLQSLLWVRQNAIVILNLFLHFQQG